MLPDDANEANRRLRTGAPPPHSCCRAYWAHLSQDGKAKAALDKAITEARSKAAAASGTTAAPFVPWSVQDLRRTVATGLQRLGIRLVRYKMSQWRNPFVPLSKQPKRRGHRYKRS
jgi:hypothetical protein